MELYLIEILHQTTTLHVLLQHPRSLYLIEILHQTTTEDWEEAKRNSCILSKFYIKPQQVSLAPPVNTVVSYRNSTSNHNCMIFHTFPFVLYLIEILHQTTTLFGSMNARRQLYLIEILHQTTTIDSELDRSKRCILSKFYIKPQPSPASRTRTTSCILSKFYIKPQPRGEVGCRLQRCILSKFYIKPQLIFCNLTQLFVVSYRNSTSNHNGTAPLFFLFALYLIEILHQTTTPLNGFPIDRRLYLIEILHQTTTTSVATLWLFRCILSKFYIKPQLFV